MPDRFTGMQVLSKVAATGSFSAAARALGMSPAMATRHVDSIEDRLGARLFHRSTRKLTLTEAGQRYLEATERILADVEEADATAAADVIEPRGTLRLNAPHSFGLRQVMPAIAEFSSHYPGLTIDVGLTDRFVDLLDEGWDLAIRIGEQRDSQLITRSLAPIRAVVCASPDYLAARGTPRAIADLANHSCLGYTLPSSAAAGRWVFGPDGKTTVTVHGSLTANNGDALRVAALAGHGLIFQPTFIVADDLRSGRLVAVTLDKPVPRFGSVNAVFPEARHLPAKVRAFVDFVGRLWAGAPWDDGLRLKTG